MNAALFLLGLVLLVAALLDIFWTALWVDRSDGPISARVTTWVWRGTVRVVGRRRHVALSTLGPVLLLSVLLMWVALLWAGWTLVFASGDTALLSTRDGTPPDWSGRIYFVGYTLSTMGNGDFQPNGSGWQIATSLTTGSGMLLITLGVSYVLSVVGAVVTKRAFAAQVASLGRNCEELLAHAWNGRDFHALDLPLNSLSEQISMHGQQFLAYPILHYYHPATPERSPAIALAMLDEALTLLRFGVPEPVRPNPAVLHSIRAGVQSYLTMLSATTMDPAPEPPSPPRLARLAARGIPTVSESEFADALDQVAERRRQLLGLVRDDGWEWPEQ